MLTTLHAVALAVAAPSAPDCPSADGVITLPAGQRSCSIVSRNPITPSSNELIYGLISFLIFFLFMAKFILPRANQALADRRAMIEGKMEDAEADRATAESLLADYRAQLSDARGEANRIKEDANSAGAAIRAERTEAAQAEAERILASARAQAEAERASVVVALRSEIGGLSLQLAERIVGVSLESDERQRQLIDTFIAGVENGTGGGPQSAATDTANPAGGTAGSVATASPALSTPAGG